VEEPVMVTSAGRGSHRPGWCSWRSL